MVFTQRGLIVDPDGSMDEMWVAVGAYPGLLCGVIFAAVFGMAEGRHRFDELSLARAGAWGRWLVCWWVYFRLFWGSRTPNSRCGCWVL